MMATATFVWSDASVREALRLPTAAETGRDRVFSAICTDTRDLQTGDLFVALIGERFDGHAFVAEALDRGAAAAVVSRPVPGVADDRLYVVPDTLAALGDLARFRRRALPARVVGIAGSVGKTGTKEMTRAALASQLRTHATPANLNNRIGVPLTLLSAPDDREAVVVEMGTSIRGEMAALTAITEPDIAVIVTVGAEHLEGIGGLDEAIDEELDVLRGLDRQALAVVGDRPPVLATRARELAANVRVAGRTAQADAAARADAVELDPQGRARFVWHSQTIQLSVPGVHAVDNALLALTVADALGVDAAAASDAVARVQPHGMRGEVRRIGSLDVVVDCYNANPQSVEAALDLLEERRASGPRIAILGSMLELGTSSDEWHDRVLASALARGIDRIVATGEFAAAALRRSEAGADPQTSGSFPDSSPKSAGKSAAEPASDHQTRLDIQADPLEAGARLVDELEGRETVLLKGSRGVALERLLPLLEARFAEPRGG